jgi:nicotinamide mononucleotide transporter
MDISQFLQELSTNLKETTALEYIGTICGIASVFYSRKENILVYPVGMVSTVIYIYLSLKGKLFGEASVNVYYTIMSIYGWILWARKDKHKHEALLHITYSTKAEWVQQLLLFVVFYVVIFFSLSWLKNTFAPGAIPWADAFASATAYTGMWLMAKKKVESWWWWIATNIASIPLYYVKHYAFTSIQFLVLLILAVAGLMEWMKKVQSKEIAHEFAVKD